MPSDARDNKAILRTKMRQRLRLLSSEEKATQSAKIRKLISSHVQMNCAIFAGTPSEPNLLPLIQSEAHHAWFLPKVTGDGIMQFYQITSPAQLAPGPYGILEPLRGKVVDPSSIETIICPGLAFSKNGQRLGQGGGFYDRFLAQATRADIYGACFDEQILPSLPEESHDLRVTTILHPSLGR